MTRQNHMTLSAKRRALPRPASPRDAGPTAPDRMAATPDKMLPFLHALAGDAESLLRAALGTPVTEQSLLAAADAALHQYDETWRYVQNLNVVSHACCAGCTSCCSLTVEASAPEVFLIADRLDKSLAPAQLAGVKDRVRRTAARIQGLTPTERVQADVPCALLEDGRCLAYNVRPLACRSWNSRDVGACERVMRDGGGDLRPVQDQRPLTIGAGIGVGFAAALHGVSLFEDTARPCELNTALSLALDDPQALSACVGGKDVLGPARSTVSYPG